MNCPQNNQYNQINGVLFTIISILLIIIILTCVYLGLSKTYDNYLIKQASINQEKIEEISELNYYDDQVVVMVNTIISNNYKKSDYALLHIPYCISVIQMSPEYNNMAKYIAEFDNDTTLEITVNRYRDNIYVKFNTILIEPELRIGLSNKDICKLSIKAINKFMTQHKVFLVVCNKVEIIERLEYTDFVRVNAYFESALTPTEVLMKINGTKLIPIFE